MKVLLKTLNDIKEEVRLRFYPRELIMLTDENVFRYLVKQGLMFLNKYGYYSRFINASCEDGKNYIDLDKVSYPDGINGANSVLKVYLLNDLAGSVNVYNMILGNMPFHYVITNHNDMFLEFLYASKLVDDLRVKYRNMDNFIVIGEKLYLDSRAYRNLGKEFVIEYIARFDLDSDKWRFFDIEYTFLLELLEAMIMYREGLAQSELSFAGELSGNYEMYLGKGEERLKEIVEKFTSGYIKSKFVRVK